MTIKATFSALARCFIVAMTTFLLLQANVAPALASESKSVRAPSCTACVRCECCVKESPASIPIRAPFSQPSAQKDFQIVPALVLIASVQPLRSAEISFVSPDCLPAAAPLYQRHCAYLI